MASTVKAQIPISAGSPPHDVKLIAFYLTQFHPIPENDTWWGKGFTEWTNVTKAKPYFKGHYQPHLPSDLGFYDLRLRETRHEQIRLAKDYGIDGFCYYYYWFSGKRILERPLEDMLADRDSQMPYCLCWANENWTRRWDAAEHEILIAQKYQPNDDRDFITGLLPHLRDARYIRVNGAPLLIVYRPQHLPDARASLAIWREVCAREGIPKLHVVCALTHGNWDYTAYGFDGGVEFPPHNMRAANRFQDLESVSGFRGYCPEYHHIARMYLSRTYGQVHNCYRGVFPSWDNTARRGHIGTVILNGTPENYEYWLASAIRNTSRDFPAEERFVFINAWNEWAEGCHLEPDRKYGHRFLEATARAKSGGSSLTGWTHVGVPAESRINPFTSPRLAGRRAMNKLRKRSMTLLNSVTGKNTPKKPASGNDTLMKELRDQYLNTMVSTLAGTIYEDPPLAASGKVVYDPRLRNIGWDWPSKAVTMIGTKRLQNIRFVIEKAIATNTRGDFVETGVWRGGACIMARAVLKAHGIADRSVIACDSFEGLPPPDTSKFPKDEGSDFHTYGDLAVSLDEVKHNFAKFGLLDDQVKFVKGFFRDTMAKVPSSEIAVLRLDGDMYESTIQVLEGLFDRVPDNGWVVIDDYHVVDACRAAVHDFLDGRNIKVNFRKIDGVGAYFKKGEAPR